jgi:hypothetical protein
MFLLSRRSYFRDFSSKEYISGPKKQMWKKEYQAESEKMGRKLKNRKNLGQNVN